MDQVADLMTWMDERDLHVIYIGRHAKGLWSVCWRALADLNAPVHCVEDVSFPLVILKAACAMEAQGVPEAPSKPPTFLDFTEAPEAAPIATPHAENGTCGSIATPRIEEEEKP